MIANSAARGRALADAQHYADRLRHPGKRAYAMAVIRAWRLMEAPPPAPPGLSTMGAQAVRLHLHDILHPVTENEAAKRATYLAALVGPLGAVDR